MPILGGGKQEVIGMLSYFPQCVCLLSTIVYNVMGQ